MKALEILQEGLEFMIKAIEVNPNSVKELQSEIDIYNEAIKELEELENRSCGNCKHWIGLYCRTYNINSDFNFYCNKWENKA